MKTGITLIAGLVATIAAPAITAQAATGPTTGQWSLMAANGTAEHYGCRIPDSTGSTINTFLTGAPAGVTAGLDVRDGNGALVDSWSSTTSTAATPAGTVYLPRAQTYYLEEWMAVDTGASGGLVRLSVEVTTALARC